MKKKIAFLGSYLDICGIHASRLKMALSHVIHLYPMEATSFLQLKDEELSYLELLISRFSKLQDILGSKIFPLLVDLLQEESKGNSFLDILHQLEKLELLPSAKDWINMRELRNHLTHEYPEHPDFMADNCNQAIVVSQDLLKYWNDLEEKARIIQEKWIQELS